MRDFIIKCLFDEIKNSGLTYSYIAKECGISVVMFSQYKNLHKLPSLETFAKLCEVIGTSADCILGLKEY